MPEDFDGLIHRIAGGDAALLGRPRGEAGHADGLGELVGLRVAGGIADVLGAPGFKVEAGREGALGVDAFLDRVSGAADGAEGVALRRGARETLVPRFSGEKRATRSGCVIVREIDLRLHAFVADPESVAAVGAERLAVREGGAWQRLGARVHGAEIVAVERGRAGWDVDGAEGDERDQCVGWVRDGGRQAVKQGLAFRAGHHIGDAAIEIAGIGREEGAVGEIVDGST